MDHELLREFHLQGRELTATIERVSGGELTAEGGKKTRKPILHLKGLPEGLPVKLGIGATICKVIEKARTPDYEKWAGLSIVLYPAETSLKGETVPCIRVRLPKEAK